MKRKGFTLVELLAVIVILAVISLIATPMILGVIETSREEAFKDNVLSAFNAVEYYVIEKGLGDVPENGIEAEFLNLKNNNFDSGRIIKNKEGVLVAEFVSDGKYCASGTLTNLTINKGECEITSPSIEASVNGKEVSITVTDVYGIVSYMITESEDEPTEWTEVEETTSINENITAEKAGTYYIHVKNKYGKTSTKEYSVDITAFAIPVTYIIAGQEYIEYVKVGDSVLSPTSFESTVTDATFLGWSSSYTSTTVETSLVMNESPMTLYAVYRYNDYTYTASQNGHTGSFSRTVYFDHTKYYRVYINFYRNWSQEGNDTTISGIVSGYDDEGDVILTKDLEVSGYIYATAYCQADVQLTIIMYGRTVVG